MNSTQAQRISYFLLRVVSGLLFFQAGSVKLLGWYGGMPGGASSPPPLTSPPEQNPRPEPVMIRHRSASSSIYWCSAATISSHIGLV